MPLFNIFKKQEPQKQQNEQSLEEYMADLRAQRMVERKPVLSHGSVENAPAGFNHFNLDDVLIGYAKDGLNSYLFAGDNAATLMQDFQIVNDLSRSANALVPGLPDFHIDGVEIAFDPFPNEKRHSWLFSKLRIEDLTETGKLKKYPVSAIVETITGEKYARLHYTLGGVIGKGSVSVHLFPNTKKFVIYGFDFINGVVSHVWENTENGKAVLYNKNNGNM